jgi:3-oxoadipate enol-lactonase
MQSGRLNHRIDGEGPPLVLLHPIGLDLTCWEPMMESLGTARTIIRIDHRGHGLSAPTDPDPTLRDYAQDVHNLLSGLGIAHAAVAGLSFGGMVAQTLALDFPEDVSSLVVAGCPTTFPDENVRALVRQRGSDALDGMEAVIPATLERWFTADFIEAGKAEPTRERLRKDDPKEWAAAWTAISQIDTLPRLHEISVPTLCVAGEADKAAPPAVLKSIADAISGAQLAVLPGVPHMMQIEKAELFGEATRSFLDGSS